MFDKLRIKVAEAILGRRLRGTLYLRSYAAGSHDGYEDGYQDGYREGSEEGQEYGFELAQTTVDEWHKPLSY